MNESEVYGISFELKWTSYFRGLGCLKERKKEKKKLKANELTMGHMG